MNLELAKSVRMLSQDTPPNTNAYSVVSAGIKRKVLLTSIIIVNTTSNAAAYSLYLNKNGNTYNTATTISYNTSLAANTMALLEFTNGLPIDLQYAGNFAIQSGTANALTFTTMGIELS